MPNDNDNQGYERDNAPAAPRRFDPAQFRRHQEAQGSIDPRGADVSNADVLRGNDQEEPRQRGGVNGDPEFMDAGERKARAEQEREKKREGKTQQFRVLTKHAIINGEKHSDDDGNGVFGIVELTPAEARTHQEHGVALQSCSQEEDGFVEGSRPPGEEDHETAV